MHSNDGKAPDTSSVRYYFDSEASRSGGVCDRYAVTCPLPIDFGAIDRPKGLCTFSH